MFDWLFKDSKEKCYKNYPCPVSDQETCRATYPCSVQECPTCPPTNSLAYFTQQAGDLGTDQEYIGETSLEDLTFDEAAQRCLDTEGCVGFSIYQGKPRWLKSTLDVRPNSNFTSFVRNDIENFRLPTQYSIFRIMIVLVLLYLIVKYIRQQSRQPVNRF